MPPDLSTPFPLPPAFEFTALFDLLVPAPQGWPLRIFRGHHRRGLLVFADLLQPRLEIRWRRPYLFRPTLEQLANHFHKKHPDSEIDSLPSARILRTNSSLYLIAQEPSATAAQARIFELHFPPPSPKTGSVLSPHNSSIVTTLFLQSLQQSLQRPDRYWSVYGAAAWVPARAKLIHIELLPGRTQLTLTHSRGTTTLGSYSIADRLLQNQSLHEWAQRWPYAAKFKIPWRPAPAPDTVELIADARRFLRPLTHHLTLRHDPAANRLTWQHHITRSRATNRSRAPDRNPGL